MIEPYNAVSLVPACSEIRRREDVGKNLDHLERLAEVAIGQWLQRGVRL